MTDLPIVPEIEKALCAAALQGGAQDLIASGVRSEFFALGNCRAVFASCERLVSGNLPVDPVSVITDLRCVRTLDAAGGETGVAELIGESPTSVVQEAYVAKLLEMAGRRAALTTAHAKLQELRDTAKDPKRTCAEFLAIFADAEKLVEGASVRSFVGGIDDYLAALQTIQQGRGNGVIVPWGIKDVDKVCQLQRGQIFALVAGANTGKTRFILSDLAGMIRSGTVKDNPVLIFSTENKRRILWDGLLSIFTGIPARQLNSPGALSEADVKSIQEWAAYCKGFRSCVGLFGKGDYKPTPAGIFSTVKAFERANGVKVAKVCVDYLQNHRPNLPLRFANKTTELETLIGELTGFVGTDGNDSALVILSQLNRDKLRTGRPMLNDIKGTTALEQESDFVSFLFRDKGNLDELQFYAAKSRGGFGTWDERLAFDHETGSITHIKGKYEP